MWFRCHAVYHIGINNIYLIQLFFFELLQNRLRNDTGTMQRRILRGVMELLRHLDSAVSEILTSQFTDNEQFVLSGLPGFPHLLFCHFQYVMVVGSGQAFIRGDYYQSRGLLLSRFVLTFIEIFIIDLR